MLAAVLVGFGVTGCGYGNNNTSSVGCGFANTAAPGPAPVAGSEFLFVPNALCGPGVANDVMSVLVLDPATGNFNNGPVPLVQTGNVPVWATVDPTNHFVYVTNFADNTVSAFTLNTANGQVGVVPGSPFPAGTGPAAAAVDPSGTFLYVANQGTSTIAGSISGYKISANGALTAVPGSPFTTMPTPLSPQQGIAVTLPQGPGVFPGFVYVSNSNVNNTSTLLNNVSAFSFNGTGTLTQLATSPFTLAPALTPQPESLAMDPAGKFLFTANMTSNNVSAFTVNADGSLTQVTGSPFSTGFSSPQYLATDQTGSFLYVVNVANNSNVTAYTIAGSGALTQLGTALSTGNVPEGLAVDKANKFLMVANLDDGTLSVYGINNGNLTALGPLSSSAIIAGPQMVATTH
jgi:6-phosphogluconolactonase (cycloisomerase 2 family)